MLYLYFEGVAPSHSFYCDPTPCLRLGSGTLHNGAEKLIAQFKRGFWEAGERAYNRLVCDGPLSIMFENDGGSTPVAAELCGTFDKLEIVGNTLWADKEYLASLNAENHWQSCRSGRLWQAVKLAVAGSEVSNGSNILLMQRASR